MFFQKKKRVGLFLILGFVFWGCASKGPEVHGVRQESEVSSSSSHEEVLPFYQGMSPILAHTEKKAEDEKIIGEEVEEEIDRRQALQPDQFDIPIVLNAQVEQWMNYFQNSGRRVFSNWLARSGKYIPMMRKILRENDLPEDLVYLSMIESGFKPYAYSRAKASGPWQFIKHTGNRYGLRTDWWIDERRDPEKSTMAAAQHLKDLYDQFKHWHLAAAGYNAGAAKVARAMERYSTEDFWEMCQFRYLKRETKNYVPKLIAAALIAKNPEQFGFVDIVYEEPLQYDKVVITEPVFLSAVASILNVDLRGLKELNPELKKDMTPPHYSHYELKVPKGYKDQFENAFAEIRQKSTMNIVQHVVKKGETLSTIARRYGVNRDAIQTFNQLPSSRLSRGQQLAIPVRLASFSGRTKATPVRRASLVKEVSKGYVVQAGDTLWSISRRFDVTVSELRQWNGISSNQKIHPGLRLKVIARADPPMLQPSSKEVDSPRWFTYQVQPGDTLWGIAKRHNVPLSDLRQWNDLQVESKLHPGLSLKIRLANL